MQSLHIANRSLQLNFIRKEILYKSLNELRKMPARTKVTAVDISEIKDELESQKLKHRHHPGKRRIKCVTLPDRLVNAAKRLLIDHSRHQLLSDSNRLNNILKSRKLPAEENELRDAAKMIEDEILAKESQSSDASSVNDDELRLKLKNKILRKLRLTVHHWKPIQYDNYHSLLYITRRLAPEYAALKQVFMEIKHHDPSFVPNHLFDFGSGIGSVLWVAHSLWGEHIKDYFCVDSSADMNTTSQLLLQDGNSDAEMFIKGVFFRQFLPVSDEVKYDLVVSSYSLMELPSSEYRLQVIDTLWRKCNKYMVIIDHGSNAGYHAVLEARDYILKLESNEDENFCGAHVIAPCPHDFSCPRLMDNTQTPCNFEVMYQEFPLDHKVNVNTERFSYVILKKGPRLKGNKEPWPRIVREVLPRARHVVCRLCCSDGQLHEVIFTKYKHGRHLYRCARCSKWGDLIPATIVDIPGSDAVDETKEL